MLGLTWPRKVGTFFLFPKRGKTPNEISASFSKVSIQNKTNKVIRENLFAVTQSLMFIINLKLQKKLHHAKLFHAHELNNFVIVEAIYNNNFWIRLFGITDKVP